MPIKQSHPKISFLFWQDGISSKQAIKKHSRGRLVIACIYWVCAVYRVRAECRTCDLVIFLSQPRFKFWTTNLKWTVRAALLTALPAMCFFSLYSDDFIHLLCSQNPVSSPVFILSWWPCSYLREKIEAIGWEQIASRHQIPNLSAFVPLLSALPLVKMDELSLFLFCPLMDVAPESILIFSGIYVLLPCPLSSHSIGSSRRQKFSRIFILKRQKQKLP